MMQLECGPMPNLMVALPNMVGALCSTPQSFADTHYYMYMPPTNAVETRKPLKVSGVPQTPETISAASGPKFTILWAHMEQIWLLNKFFFRLSIHALVAKIWPDKFVRWRHFCVLYLQRAARSAFQTCILNSH